MKKISSIIVILFLLALPAVLAEAATSVPPDFQPIADALQILFQKLNVLMGGIFGIYLIFILFRIHHERQKIKLLKSILYNLDQLNKFHHLPIAREQPGFWRRLFPGKKEAPEDEKAEPKISRKVKH